MNESVRVRFPCIHNQWFRHFVGNTYEWCEGGTTRHLRRPTGSVDVAVQEGIVWVEVDDA
jgi:hypothetical protein